MANISNLNLSENLDTFIHQMVDSGRYASTDEVIHTALNMLAEQEHALSQLRQAIDEGEESGYATENLSEMMQRVRKVRGL